MLVNLSVYRLSDRYASKTQTRLLPLVWCVTFHLCIDHVFWYCSLNILFVKVLPSLPFSSYWCLLLLIGVDRRKIFLAVMVIIYWRLICAWFVMIYFFSFDDILWYESASPSVSLLSGKLSETENYWSEIHLYKQARISCMKEKYWWMDNSSVISGWWAGENERLLV